MAANTKNKYPADKAGTRYADFRNTKRLSTSKSVAAKESKQVANNSPEPADSKSA